MAENEVRRIAISFTALMLGAAVFLLSTPPWDTPTSATAYYSILAFLCITITVGSRNRNRTDPSPAHSFFTAGTLYASLVFGGAAIFYVYNDTSEVTHLYSSGVFLNLVAFATTGLSMLVYSYLQKNPPSESSRWNNRKFPMVFVVVGIVIFISLIFVTRSLLTDALFIGYGYAVGSVAFISYSLASIILFRDRRIMKNTHDPIRLSISFALLGFACLIHMWILPSPNILWLGSISLMVIAFIYAIVSTGYSFLIDLNVNRNIAYAIASSISVLVVLPFLSTQIIEASLSIGTITEHGAPMLIHIGGAIFAASLTIILYKTSQDMKNLYIYPIMALFLFWTIAEFGLFVSHLVTPSESRIPYISGSIISIVFLLLAVSQILNPSANRIALFTNRMFVLLGVLFVAMISLGEIIQAYLFEMYPLLFTGKFGTALMLGLSYISLFVLLDFFLLLSGLSGGKITFDSLAVGAASIWLVIIIMKANFSVWTMGYWAAEGVLGISVAIFPLLLIYYFLEQYNRNTLLETSATIYSSFLTDRIATHHSKAIDVLDGMTKEPTLEDKRLEQISKALQEVSVAEELTQTMCSVLQEDRFSSSVMEPMDLVDIIMAAVHRLGEKDKILPDIKSSKNRGSCYVVGNSLLIDLFHQLFEGVIQRIGSIRGIDLTIDQEAEDVTPSWHSTLTLEVISQDASKMKFLFDRYTRGEWTVVPELAFAYRLIRLFRGSITAESIIGASTQLWLILRIQLPSTPAIS